MLGRLINKYKIKIALSPERLRVVITAVISLIILVLYLFWYRPLLVRLKSARIESNTIESELSWAKQAIAPLTTRYPKKTLINENDIPLLIDELTKKGKSQGINFISVNTQKIETTQDSRYGIIPIEMEIESSYEQLGQFLGLLDGLKNGIVTLRSFQITNRENNPWRLRTRLVINAYIASRPSGMPLEPQMKEKYTSLKRSARRTTYTQWGRNPFSQSTQAAKAGLFLTGIVWDALVAKAIIGNTIVGIGDKIDGHTVVDIQKDKVILNDGTKDFELKLE